MIATATSTPWRSGSFRGPAPELLFGRMFEDWRIENAAFAARSRVFCIASAGCTALRLAGAGHQVTAVDINPSQVAYVQRRLAGGGVSAGRADHLLGAARALLGRMGWGAAEREDFLSLRDPGRQRRWWRARLGRGILRAAVLAALHPLLLRLAYAQPFVRTLPTRFAKRLLGRLERGIATHANHDNPLAWWLLLGRLAPWHAEPAPVAGIGLGLADAATALAAAPRGSIDGFALSNILDGAGPGYRSRLVAAVRHAAAPGARVVLRSFADPRDSDADRAAARDRAWLWGSILVCDADRFR